MKPRLLLERPSKVGPFKVLEEGRFVTVVKGKFCVRLTLDEVADLADLLDAWLTELETKRGAA